MVFIDVSNVVPEMDGVKQVLYISYDGMTDPLGQSQVIPYLEGLSKLGYQFTLISFEKPDRFQALAKDIGLQLKNAGIEWLPQEYSNKIPVISPVLLTFQLLSLVKKQSRNKRFDIVHCRGYISSFGGLWLKRNTHAKFIFDMRGFWADERVDGGSWPQRNPVFKLIYTFLKVKEREFLRSCDAVVTLTSRAKAEILSWGLGLHEDKITVIPCCADMSLFSEENINPGAVARIRKLIGGEPVLSYIGSVGTWYMLQEMLDFFRVFQSGFPKAKFAFYTLDNPEQIRDAARKSGIDDDAVFITPVSRRDMPNYIAASDFSIFFIKPSYSKQASSPTKHAEIMSLGVPVICNAGVGDMSAIMETTNSGFLVSAFNNEEYKRIYGLAKDKVFDRHSIRSSCAQIYSLDNGVTQYDRIYQQLAEKEKV